jgi:hypothetical protein
VSPAHDSSPRDAYSTGSSHCRESVLYGTAGQPYDEGRPPEDLVPFLILLSDLGLMDGLRQPAIASPYCPETQGRTVNAFLEGRRRM